MEPSTSRQPPTSVSSQESHMTNQQGTSSSLAPSLQMLSPSTTQQALARQPLAEKPPESSENEAPQIYEDQPLSLQRKKTFIHVPLPGGLKYAFADEEGKAITGVLASRVVDKGETFGPYNGSLLDEEAGKEIGSSWEVRCTCIRMMTLYRVAQKECNTFDHQFQRNQGLNQSSECSNQ